MAHPLRRAITIHISTSPLRPLPLLPRPHLGVGTANAQRIRRDSLLPSRCLASSARFSAHQHHHHHTEPHRTTTHNTHTMEATAGHSKACCNVPPVVATGYQTKGAYSEVGGYKTYVTGPEDAAKGIIAVYDIFGYFDQTLQGADILATSSEQKYRVFMPDWFKGKPCPIEWYPPNTEEKQKNLGAWFGNWNPADTAAKVPEYVKAVQAANPNIKSWGIIGYCWGGKIVCLVTSSPSNPFSAGASIHPAMVDANDAKKIKVPIVMLGSMEDPADDIKAFGEAVPEGVPRHVEMFGDQVHGWMAARADLSDERVKEEYVRGYKTVLEFFAKHWDVAAAGARL